MGTIDLFGHDAASAAVTLLPRSLSWRTRRAIGFAVLGLVLAPVVALLPPHAVWLIGALSTGGYLSWRNFTTRCTVVRLEGRCPRCEAELSLREGTRFRQPHPISCQNCHHELTLSVDPVQLPR